MSTKKQPTKEQLQQLYQLFSYFHPSDIGKGVEKYLAKTVFCHSITKGDYLQRSGEISKNLYFIEKGAVRGFIKEDKKEITTWFAVESEIVSTITSFLMQIATPENVQAIEDCELLGLSFADLEKLYQQYPSFNVVGRKITELYYAISENRAYITRLHNAERKYNLFLQSYPHIAKRVKLTHIASFLGITIGTLSRVRSKTSPKKHNSSRKPVKQ